MAVCKHYNIADFGAKFDGSDDTEAWKDAIATIDAAGGGILNLCVGTSKTTETLYLSKRIIIQGMGVTATTITNPSSDIFVIGHPTEPPDNPPFVQDIHFRDMTIQSGGGHIFVLEANAFRCSWVGVDTAQFNASKQIFRRVTASAAKAGFYDCLWQFCFMRQTQNSIVPAFEISTPSQQFNSNSLRDIRCQNSGMEPFFKFNCGTHEPGMSRNNGNVMSRINFEGCLGGMVHWYSAGNWLCEALVQYDLDMPTTGHGLFLGKGQYGGPTRHMTFIGCDRRSGSRGTGKYDIYLNPGHALDTVLINCGENPNTDPNVEYTVNANGNSLTWIGMRDTDLNSTHPRLENGQISARIGNGEIRAFKIEQDQ